MYLCIVRFICARRAGEVTWQAGLVSRCPRLVCWLCCVHLCRYMFVLLGRTGEVSVFGPITSLYLFVPVVYGLVFLGEALTVRSGEGEGESPGCAAFFPSFVVLFHSAGFCWEVDMLGVDLHVSACRSC